MKKVLALILALCMAFALAVPAYAADEEEVSGPLVLYSSMTEFDLEALITCFNEVYPDVEIEVVSGSVGEYTSRIAAEADNPQGDVTWGGLCDSDGMTHEALFEKWVSIHNDEAMEGYSTPNGFYSMDHLSTVCFCVNTELEEELGLDIRSYEDLLNPALKGKIVISDPNSSSAAWNNLCNIMSVFGNDSEEAWDYIGKLMKNLVISDSSSNCFKLVEQGEYVVGLTYEDGAIKLIQQGAGDHFDMRYPADGASASAFGMAVIKNCKHPAAAKALVNWVCSAEGCSYIAQYLKTLRMTNKDTVYGESLLPATEDIKWVHRDVPYLTEHKAEILEHWNDLLLEVQG